MYIVEGNIGAGKSTFLRLIDQTISELKVAYEPMDRWDQRESGQSLLSKFYEDPKRWTFSLETFAMMCRVRDHLKRQKGSPLTIIERSIYSGHYCFAKNGYLHKFMTEAEWQVYERWFQFLIPNKCDSPLGFIYLKTDPKVSFERVRHRGRESERELLYDYLVQINQRHDDFLLNKVDVSSDLMNVPVLVLDCNEDFENNPVRWEEHAQRVSQFITQTHVAPVPPAISQII
ncbi:MAG TPA: deoxynucleoside kinase [Candidatus Babeliales bacterium]|nr:deoxynucleoside kinase [Candidatus Babeliales bacterium]